MQKKKDPIRDGSLDVFFMEFWEATFNCQWNYNCSALDHLDNAETPLTDVAELDYAYNSYMAVYAIAYALKDLYACAPGQGPFHNGSCANAKKFSSWQVYSMEIIFHHGW